MIDKDKLDAFFDGSTPKNKKAKDNIAKHTQIVRMSKLILPAIAAGIIGLLLIIPSLKDATNDILFDITKPKFGELEKLHVENMVFNITDADNRVSNFYTPNIDETAPQSKLIKLAKPKGRITLSDDSWIDIKSKVGYFNQTDNVLNLQQAIEADFNKGMLLETTEVFYDFNKSMGYGKKPVTGTGTLGDVRSQGFEINSKKKIITFTGKTFIKVKEKGTNLTINADKRVEWYQNDNKIIAIGNAVAIKDKSKIKAEKIEGFYAKDSNGKFKLDRIVADDNVIVYANNMEAFGSHIDHNVNEDEILLEGKPSKIKGKGGIVSASEGIRYSPSKGVATAVGNVKIDAKDGTVTADKGEYFLKQEIVKLYNNVTIAKDGNYVKGDKAETNLKTGISRLIADKPTSDGSSKKGGRVTGVFKEKKKDDK